MTIGLQTAARWMIVSLGLALGAAGCATRTVQSVKDYEDPAHGPTATIEFVGLTEIPVRVFAYQDRSCRGASFVGETVPPIHNRRGRVFVATMPAGQPFTYSMAYRDARNPARPLACVLATTFEPGAGAHYQAIFSAEGNNCQMRLWRRRAGSFREIRFDTIVSENRLEDACRVDHP